MAKKLDDISRWLKNNRFYIVGIILLGLFSYLYETDPFLFRMALIGLVGLAVLVGLIFLAFKKPAVAIALFLLIIIIILLVK